MSQKLEDLIAALALSSMNGDAKTFRLNCLTAIRLLQKTNPTKANVIADTLANFQAGANPLRGVGLTPPPLDRESGLDLAKVIAQPSQTSPILPAGLLLKLDRFLHEHLSAGALLREGIVPPASILLYGDPGVGKTMLGEFFAWKSNRELIHLDLASSISSLLGRTGQNLKKVLDYAKSKPTVLFLDEFDAIAKDRDDRTDLGELKRIVNVLLKELEDWPHHSLLVAATNHPKLLDKAIWRRFDGVFEIPLPSANERSILIKSLLRDQRADIVRLLCDSTEGFNAAEVTKICQRILRRSVLEKHSIEKLVFEELLMMGTAGSKKSKSQLIKKMKQAFPKITLEEISAVTDLSISTIHYHLKG
jgi:SpoVK/Ycf46/Vps4 family AAA+-type ATPase